MSENFRFMNEILPEVRTTQADSEPFDSRIIIDSLMRETGLDYIMAENVTKRVLRRIIQYNVQWISKSTIRDVCSAVLEEMGLLEEHKLYSRTMNKKIKQIRRIVNDYMSNGFHQNDNANMVRHVSGLFNWVTQYDMKKYALAIYDNLAPNAVRLHEDGAIHIHDLWTSVYCAYCSGFDLRKIILDGLHLAKRAGPAKRLDSILNQIINFIVSIQQEFAGAIAFSSFDTLLAPYIKKYNLSYKKVKQEIQSLFYNLNQPSRYGFQSPFVNFNVDLVVPKHLRGVQPVIGGELLPFTYDDCKEQMDMINRAICEMHIEGDYNSAPFTFPIITVQIGSKFDWDDPIRSEYIKLSSLRGQPYWLNYNVDYLDEDMNLSMCCRLKIDYNELIYHTGGVYSPGDATGSIGIVSLNMPRVGYLSTTEDQIYEMVDEILEAARNQLIAKRILINKSLDNHLLPATSFHLQRGFKFHFNTIGIVGMHDFCMNYLNEPIWTPASQALVVKVLKYINEQLAKFQVEDKMLYNLEQTPAERTAARFAYYDFNKYKDVFISVKENDVVEYTNSTHLPVEHDNIFDRIEIEGKFQREFTGGSVSHLFLDEVSNTKGLSKFAQNICEKSQLGYFSFTPTLSNCRECRQTYVGNFLVCPRCGADTDVYSRIVGYYRPVNQWNPAKKLEFDKRKQFQI
ncbi:MAG: ribonucleoside triphosphate reductase [Candidatus Helarchaeota archaeon]